MLAQVPRSGGDAPCLETSRVSLRALSNLTQLKMPLLVGCRVVGPEHADKVPFIPHHSVIPWAAGRGHAPLSLCSGGSPQQCLQEGHAGDRGRLACPAEQQAADGNVALPEPQGCREMLAVLAAWGQQPKPGAGSGSFSRSRRVSGSAGCLMEVLLVGPCSPRPPRRDR